jgi:hypothetical protein
MTEQRADARLALPNINGAAARMYWLDLRGSREIEILDILNVDCVTWPVFAIDVLPRIGRTAFGSCASLLLPRSSRLGKVDAPGRPGA